MFIIQRLILILTLCWPGFAQADRIKIWHQLPVFSNQLVGYGVVVGLAGTGDGNTGHTTVNAVIVSRFGVTSGVDGFNGDNAAAVMITAELPPFFGQQSMSRYRRYWSNITKGGTLLMAPLLGADGETYAVAQGNIVVGGLGVEGADNSH